MKKRVIIPLLILLCALPLLVTGCGIKSGSASKLLKYSGKQYYPYVDTAFYNVIDAAPIIDYKILDGIKQDDGAYLFGEIAYGEFTPNSDGNIALGTKFENIYIYVDTSINSIRRYSIQNADFELYVDDLGYGWEYSNVFVGCNRDDEDVLSASPEEFAVMFSDNVIDKGQLETDYSSKKYSDIVGDLGSIGQLQYFWLNGEDENDQNIRIMWYCPDEQKILTLYFNANTQDIYAREVSDAEGNILESDFRMTTAELEEYQADLENAAAAEKQAEIDAENQRFAGVNENRKKNDTDLTTAEVGDVVKFGSYPFENRWDKYKALCEIDYIYSCVDDGLDTYDELELKTCYLTSVCGTNSNGCYPNAWLGSAESMISEDWEYADQFYRFVAGFPYNFEEYINDDNELEEYYKSHCVGGYYDTEGCYWDDIYPDFESYKQEFHDTSDILFSNCPNILFDDYDDFKETFDDYFAEQRGIITTSYQPVEWDVLAIEDNKMLLLADNVLFEKPFYTFNDSNHKMTAYEDSELRTFLNDELYEAMFSDEEKEKIQESYIANMNSAEFVTEYRMDDNNAGQTVPSKMEYANTKDKLFLLGYDEILKYYGELEEVSYPDGLFNTTGYGRNDLTAPFINTEDNVEWWLRNTNEYEFEKTLAVNAYGVITNALNKGGAVRGVRPAMWVQIDK